MPVTNHGRSIDRRSIHAGSVLAREIFQGDDGSFDLGTTRYFRGWQDRDLWEDELAFVLGPEEYSARMAQLTASINRTETFVLRYREDLSRAIKAERTDQ